MINNKYLILGFLVLILAWFTPFPYITQGSFSSHMSIHMAVVAVAAPLLSLGILTSGKIILSKYAVILSPISSTLFEFIVVWGWHLPGPHHFARHEFLGLFLEQGTFLLAGVWLWTSCLASTQRAPGVIGLLLTSMHMTMLGALLGLAPRTLYNHSELQDQQLGGAIMLTIGGIVYLWGGVSLAGKLSSFRKQV